METNFPVHWSNLKAICDGQNNCSGGDNAWHFMNGNSNYFVGPCLGCQGDMNCTFWNNVDSSSYTRITACVKPGG